MRGRAGLRREPRGPVALMPGHWRHAGGAARVNLGDVSESEIAGDMFVNRSCDWSTASPPLVDPNVVDEEALRKQRVVDALLAAP